MWGGWLEHCPYVATVAACGGASLCICCVCLCLWLPADPGYGRAALSFLLRVAQDELFCGLHTCRTTWTQTFPPRAFSPMCATCLICGMSWWTCKVRRGRQAGRQWRASEHSSCLQMQWCSTAATPMLCLLWYTWTGSIMCLGASGCSVVHLQEHTANSATQARRGCAAMAGTPRRLFLDRHHKTTAAC